MFKQITVIAKNKLITTWTHICACMHSHMQVHTRSWECMACWRTCTHPHTRAWVHTRMHSCNWLLFCDDTCTTTTATHPHEHTCCIHSRQKAAWKTCDRQLILGQNTDCMCILWSRAEWKIICSYWVCTLGCSNVFLREAVDIMSEGHA